MTHLTKIDFNLIWPYLIRNVCVFMWYNGGGFKWIKYLHNNIRVKKRGPRMTKLKQRQIPLLEVSTWKISKPWHHIFKLFCICWHQLNKNPTFWHVYVLWLGRLGNFLILIHGEQLSVIICTRHLDTITSSMKQLIMR